eukprot:gb/GECH01013125.1/.p1 GENE.gb/GECH01013125.1/~~gb/GECH01013125.1/.p1  ORF type:complete len:288 (+),score=90.12 gb/GECH01013125.1/:1-864(+)
MKNNRSLPILDDVKKRDIERQLRVLGYKDVPDELVQELLEELHSTTEEEYLSLLNDEESFEEESSTTTGQETNTTTTEASSSYEDTDDDFEDSRWTDEEFGDESGENSYEEDDETSEESVDEYNVNTESEDDQPQVPPLSYPTAIDPNFQPYVPEQLRQPVQVPQLKTPQESQKRNQKTNKSPSSRRRPVSVPSQRQPSQHSSPASSPTALSSRTRNSSCTFYDRRPVSSRSGVIYQRKTKRKKSDPVARYQQMQQVWKRDRFLSNSSSNHKHLRWRVRCQMLAGEG